MFNNKLGSSIWWLLQELNALRVIGNRDIH